MDGAMFCAFCGTNVQALYGGSEPSKDKDEESSIVVDGIPEENDIVDEESSIVVDGIPEENDIVDEDESVDVPEDTTGCDLEDEENEYALEPVEHNSIALYENGTIDDLQKAFLHDDKYIIPLGEYEVSAPAGMMTVARINQCFDDMSLKAARYMGDFYTRAGDIESVINGVNNVASEALQIAAERTLKFLGMYEIYDYTSASILEYTGRKSRYRQHDASSVEIWDAAIGSIYDKYCAINEEAENEKMRREMRKEGRGRMQGMGFGLSGAIEAQMKAGAYNMATGAAHSIFNAVGNAMTDSARSSSLKDLYESIETKQTLMNGIYNAIQQIKFDTIALCGWENVYNRQGIGKVNTILENISKGAVPEHNINSVLVDSFAYDPFNENLYRYLIERIGDPNYELSILARCFAMEDCVGKIKNEALVNNINNNSFIKNKKAIVELVSDEKNVDWVDYIEDSSQMSKDVEWVEKIYDDLSLNVDNAYVMSSLGLLVKNIANTEGLLTNDVLVEMLYTYYKYSYEIDKLADVKTTLMETVDLEFLAGKYCLDIKRIEKDCFAGLQIKDLHFGNISPEYLEEGAFRNSTIEKIDRLNTKNIPSYAFEKCKNIIRIDFLQNTESIGEGAFCGCEKLQLVVLPRTVITLSDNISDNKNICYECYDRNIDSYKICTSFGWNTKISAEAEEFEKGQEYEKQGAGNQAFQCYKIAADGEYVYAYEPLAKCYYNAIGTEQNFDESLKYFIMADKAFGDPMCKHTIGYMYQNGQGAPADIFKAIMYYLEAGKAGVAWSMHAIAMIYYQGLGGYANYIEAAKWFAKAASAGDKTAKSNLEQLLAQNPGFPAVPDNGDADYDIKYLAQHNVTAVTNYLFNEFDNKAGSGFYYYGMTEKAVKKFNNAIKEYVPLHQGEIPMICFDHTIFGSAKDGCVLTDYGVYIHNDGGEKQQIPYSQIAYVTKDGKNINLNQSDGVVISIEVGDDDKLVKLEDLIHQCLLYFK